MTRSCVRYRAARGGLYVWVLGVAALMTLMVLSGLEFTQIAARKADLTRQMTSARLLARAALEWGLEEAQSSTARAAWAANSTPLNAAALSTGAMTLSVADPSDGNLASGIDDPVVLTATGSSGVAKQILRASLTTVADPMSCLTTAACSKGNISISAATITATGTLATNGNCAASSSTVNAPVEAGGAVTGSVYVKPHWSGMVAKAMPDATSISTWTSRARAIDFAATTGNVRRLVLSPGSNPYGSTNSAGIYVIDCGGSDITIRDVRIVGTLIILNPGVNSLIRGGISLEPIDGQPSLIIQGSMKFALESSYLSELGTLTNFNPASTPYKGSSNILMLDTYPSQFGGLVYVSGDATISESATFNGVLVVGGRLTMTAATTFNRDVSIADKPPIGFRSGTRFVLAPGSVEQTVNP